MSGSVYFSLLKTLRVSSKDTRISLCIKQQVENDTSGSKKTPCSVYIIVCMQHEVYELHRLARIAVSSSLFNKCGISVVHMHMWQEISLPQALACPSFFPVIKTN